MDIAGTFGRSFRRDERTGYAVFTLRPSDRSLPVNQYGDLVFAGVIQPLPPGTPLIVSTDDDPKNDRALQMTGYQLGGAGSSVSKFLTGDVVSGIGDSGAEAIEMLTGGDVFSLLKDPDAVARLKEAGIRVKTAEHLLKALKKIASMKETADLMAKYGAGYDGAVKAASLFGDDAPERIRQDPYVLLSCGVSFPVTEFIAKDLGLEQYDTRRLRGLLKETFRTVLTAGSTKITLKGFCRLAARIEAKGGTGYQTSPFFLGAALFENGYVFTDEADGYYVHDPDVFRKETAIADAVLSLSSDRSIMEVTPEMIDEIEKECGISYSPQQKEAFGLLTRPGLKILTGGPGTGKTTVINGMIRAFDKAHPYSSIVLCAPTGCAARRMQKATGRKAVTIHRLLDIRPFGRDMIQTKDEYDTLDADLLVVDETSMIDTELCWMLLRAVKRSAVVLFVGDEDQLPSVGAGSVLHDLLDVKSIERVRLKEVFRQKNGSVILDNSLKIRSGDKTLKIAPEYSIIETKSDSELLGKVKEILKEPSAPGQVMLYTTVKNRKYPLSTDALNRLAHDIKGYGKRTDKLVYGSKEFYRGDPVIFLKNDYALGCFNGETGIVTDIADEEGAGILVIDKDGTRIDVGPNKMDKVDLAYAITAHKAQGSECDTAVVILPDKPSNMLTRSLLYVATTRAKKRVLILSENGSLGTAIETDRSRERETSLLELIEKEIGGKSRS